MTFEEARENFISTLGGEASGPPDYQPQFPSEAALDTLATVNEPMDQAALRLLREEVIDEWLTDDDPRIALEHQTWAQAVLLIREHRRRDENGEWDVEP